VCFDARVCFDVCVCLDVCACFDAYVWLGGCLLVVTWPTADQKKARCTSRSTPGDKNTTHRTSTHCNTLQHKRTTHCNTLRHERRLGMSSCTSLATREDNSLKHNTKDCNTLQHTATHCNTRRQRTATHYNTKGALAFQVARSLATREDNTLKHNATHRNTLQHTATQKNNTRQHARRLGMSRCTFLFANQIFILRPNVLQWTAACCSVLQSTSQSPPLGKSVCCSVLQRVTVCCGQLAGLPLW